MTCGGEDAVGLASQTHEVLRGLRERLSSRDRVIAANPQFDRFAKRWAAPVFRPQRQQPSRRLLAFDRADVGRGVRATAAERWGEIGTSAGPARCRVPVARLVPGQSDVEADALRLQRPMLAVENAKPAAGRFPLIAFGEGLYYESPIAFAAMGEFLAGRGFVVVTTPLVGTNSTIVRVAALRTLRGSVNARAAHARTSARRACGPRSRQATRRHRPGQRNDRSASASTSLWPGTRRKP